MAVHTIKKGLDLPITGAPRQAIDAAVATSHVALMADDYVFMKPRMAVKVGDEVKRGQLLFEDRKQAGVRHTAPGAGTVTAVNRGRYRALQSVVIELNEREQQGRPSDDDHQAFEAYAGISAKRAESLTREETVALLVESGLWTAIRQRPYGRVPSPDDKAPIAMFVTASDTNPGAPDVGLVLEGKEAEFDRGLQIVAKLTDGKTFLCKAKGSKVNAAGVDGITVEEFAGPHPSGTAGLHIHTLAPVSRERIAWYVGYQDVVAIGRLFSTGKLDVERVVALSGPTVNDPRVITTRIGAAIDPIVEGELKLSSGDKEVENRVISGSVLSGRKAMGDLHGYLGRYDMQISALAENRERVLFGWMTPGKNAFSTSGVYTSSMNKRQKFDFTTTTNGSHRAMVPIGMYERVFPFDILPTFLLRALLSKDLSRAEDLGALELDAEDLALCSFVSPGKEEYGQVLMDNLHTLWKEG